MQGRDVKALVTIHLSPPLAPRSLAPPKIQEQEQQQAQEEEQVKVQEKALEIKREEVQSQLQSDVHKEEHAKGQAQKSSEQGEKPVVAQSSKLMHAPRLDHELQAQQQPSQGQVDLHEEV